MKGKKNEEIFGFAHGGLDPNAQAKGPKIKKNDFTYADQYTLMRGSKDPGTVKEQQQRKG